MFKQLNKINSPEDVKKLDFSKPIKIVSGCETRQKTVLKCLSEVEKSADFVLIHDGARPFVSADVISRVTENIAPGVCAVGSLTAPGLPCWASLSSSGPPG